MQRAVRDADSPRGTVENPPLAERHSRWRSLKHTWHSNPPDRNVLSPSRMKKRSHFSHFSSIVSRFRTFLSVWGCFKLSTDIALETGPVLFDLLVKMVVFYGYVILLQGIMW